MEHEMIDIRNKKFGKYVDSSELPKLRHMEIFFLYNHEKICKTLTAKKYLSNVAQWE